MRQTVIPVPYQLHMRIGFHPDAQCCDGCAFCRTDTSNRDRKRCVLTEEILWNTRLMGLRCPLVKEDESDGTEIQTAP